jgi:hypothetical protein
MALRSPKHSLTLSGRGWYKRVAKTPRWIVSVRECPSGEEADRFFERHFQKLASAPPPRSDALAVRHAANLFVETKEQSGLHQGTVRDYDDTMLRLIRCVGGERTLDALGADDARLFVADMMSKLGPDRRQKHLINLRGFVRWCGRQGISIGWTLDDLPLIRKKVMRREKSQRRKRPWTVAEVRRLLRHGSDRMRAAMLLALNAAMGPEEIVQLTGADVRGGVIDKPRAKTGVERFAPLWNETLAALAAVPRPKNGGGGGWLFPSRRRGGAGGHVKPAVLIRRFRALCDRAGVRPDGLYNFRRTFRTIADEFGDQRAAARVMGRELPDIDTVYVLTVKRDRIERMLDHVRLSLRIDRALRAKRYVAGQRGLAKRIARRRARRAPIAGSAKRGSPHATRANARRLSKRGSGQRP